MCDLERVQSRQKRMRNRFVEDSVPRWNLRVAHDFAKFFFVHFVL